MTHCETKFNILLVDDDPKNLLALEALLESLNQNLVKAHSGEEALKCLLNQDFAVIILNVQMPQMDGFETARLIRKRRSSRHTPIIFLTALQGDNIDVKRDYTLGTVDYLLKPIVPEILLSKVKVLISLFQKTQEVKQKATQLKIANKQLQGETAKRQHAEEALRKANEKLEIKVQERTSQLVKSNKSLRAEIAEHKRAEKTLQQQIRRDQLMAATIEHIRSSLALDQILTTTVTEVQQLLKADRVLIYRLSPDGTGKVVAEAVDSVWSATLDMVLPEESFPRECYQFYCQGQPRVVHNVVQYEWAECLLEFLQQLGVKSEAIAPIVQSVEQGDKIQNHLWGLLIIHACSDYRQWQQEEVDLLTYLTKHLAIAIQHAELYQQVQMELTQPKPIKSSGRPQGNEALSPPFAQEELRVNQAREIQLQSIFESTFEAIMITDDKGFYVEANPAACQLFGVPLSQLLSKNIGNFMEPGFDFELAWRTFQQQGQATGELRILRPDGTVREVEYAAKANFLPGLHLSVLRDITERKQAEEIRLALEAQKELTRVQLHFFAMVSHEFRTPLGAILGSAQILESAAQSCSDSKRLKNIQRIKAAAKNLTQLLDDILTINRAEAGKLAVNPRLIDLEKFCRNLIEEMQLIAGSKTPIKLVSQGQCKKASLDEKLLRYILINLLSNATNYSPQGGDIELALTCERKAITFQIKDHGIGISPEDKNHLFELFHRGKNIENIPGRGLGLSIVKKSVELQGGKISLQSEEGVGTTVTVTIPL